MSAYTKFRTAARWLATDNGIDSMLAVLLVAVIVFGWLYFGGQA